LSITPHLVRNIQRSELGIQEFKSGTESSLRERPMMPAAASLPAGTATPVNVMSGTSGVPTPPPMTVPAQQTTAPPTRPVDLSQVTSTPVAAPVSRADLPAVVAIAGKSTDIRSDEDEDVEDSAQADDTANDTSPVSVSLSGPDAVQAGHTFTMTVSGSTSNTLKSMPVTLAYDTAALEVVRVEPGNWFAGGRGAFKSDVSTRGRVVMYSPVVPAGVSGGGDIARITFRATAANSTAKVWVQSALPIGRKGALGQMVLPAPQRISIR
jgi:general secretion pathway protein D